jgi:hypothetical protein
MFSNKIFRVVLVVSLTSLVCSCWSKKAHIAPKKKQSLPQQCLAKASKDQGRHLSYCNMPSYTATYKVASDSDLITVYGSMIQQLNFFEADKFTYKSTLDVHADMMFVHIRDVFADSSSGNYNSSGFQSNLYHDHDSRSGKTHNFSVRAGFTDAMTLLMQVRLALLNDQPALNLKLQEGSGAKKVRPICIDLASLPSEKLTVPFGKKQSITARKFTFTNSKGKVFTYYFAQHYAYLPVKITTSSYKGLHVSIDLTSLKSNEKRCNAYEFNVKKSSS